MKKILEKGKDHGEDITNISHNLHDLDLWPFVLEKVRDTTLIYELHLS